jgi:hypothetical protein
MQTQKKVVLLGGNPKPSKDDNFAANPAIPAGLTATRSTTGTCMAYAPTAVAGDLPLVTVCAINELRFTNARRISEGVWSAVLNDGSAIPLPITLLAEEARTNLLLYSQTLDNAYWVKGPDVTVSADQITAPDGTLTGDKVSEAATTAQHKLTTVAAVTIIAGSTQTISGYFKKGTRRYIWFIVSDIAGSNYYIQYFDLDNNIPSAGGKAGTLIDKISVSVVVLGGGWVHCILTVSVSASIGTPTSLFPVIGMSPTEASTYLGVITDYTYMWGLQMEQAVNASSYIPTTTAAVTRTADIPSFTGAGLSWYNPQQGTFAITAAGSAFKAPSDLGALALTYASQTKYLLGYNNNAKSGSTYLYTAATQSNPTEYTGVAVPTTIYVNAAGIANISRFTYYPKALKPSKMAALL